VLQEADRLSGRRRARAALLMDRTRLDYAGAARQTYPDIPFTSLDMCLGATG
jgi:hypothetical protein